MKGLSKCTAARENQKWREGRTQVHYDALILKWDSCVALQLNDCREH